MLILYDGLLETHPMYVRLTRRIRLSWNLFKLTPSAKTVVNIRKMLVGPQLRSPQLPVILETPILNQHHRPSRRILVGGAYSSFHSIPGSSRIASLYLPDHLLLCHRSLHRQRHQVDVQLHVQTTHSCLTSDRNPLHLQAVTSCKSRHLSISPYLILDMNLILPHSDGMHNKHPHPKKYRPLEEDGYEFIDFGSPLSPLNSPKSTSSLAKDWMFPLPLSLDDLYHGASHTYRITRTLRSGKTQTVKIDIKILPGWRKGTRIRVPGVGNQRRDDSFQDIVFVVEELPDPRFTRVENDLFISVQVPWADSQSRPYSWSPSDSAEHGCSDITASATPSHPPEELAFLKGLNGEEFALSIPRTLVEGADGTRIVGAGMPIRNRGRVDGKGDLVVR